MNGDDPADIRSRIDVPLPGDVLGGSSIPRDRREAITDDMFDDEDDYSPTMTHWFGTPWPFPHLPAPVCEHERFRVRVPVGEVCETGCGQPITADDSGVRMPYLNLDEARWTYVHAECFLRAVLCPYEIGILPGPHVHDPAMRREEGQLLMQWARDHVNS